MKRLVPEVAVKRWAEHTPAVCAVVAIRDRVFRLELTFSQHTQQRAECLSGPVDWALRRASSRVHGGLGRGSVP